MTTYAQRATERDYPDHECPPGTDPDYGQRGTLHVDTGAGVLGCYLEPACGCRIVGTGTLQHPLMIEPCPEHGPAMYPTLAP